MQLCPKSSARSGRRTTTPQIRPSCRRRSWLPHDHPHDLSEYRQHVGASSVSASGRVFPVGTTKESSAVQRPQYALGRLKTGEMNKTEAEYNAHLEALKAAGDIVWFKFEGMKFRLADNTFFTPDFAVMLADGQPRRTKSRAIGKTMRA